VINDTINRYEGTTGDIGSDPLRQYLRQYTYIDYKADDWFNRLLYALPVNGMLQQQQDVQTPIETNDDEAMLNAMWRKQLAAPTIIITSEPFCSSFNWWASLTQSK
jgi:hypothetical protein